MTTGPLPVLGAESLSNESMSGREAGDRPRFAYAGLMCRSGCGDEDAEFSGADAVDDPSRPMRLLLPGVWCSLKWDTLTARLCCCSAPASRTARGGGGARWPGRSDTVPLHQLRRGAWLLFNSSGQQGAGSGAKLEKTDRYAEAFQLGGRQAAASPVVVDQAQGVECNSRLSMARTSRRKCSIAILAPVDPEVG